MMGIQTNGLDCSGRVETIWGPEEPRPYDCDSHHFFLLSGRKKSAAAVNRKFYSALLHDPSPAILPLHTRYQLYSATVRGSHLSTSGRRSLYLIALVVAGVWLQGWICVDLERAGVCAVYFTVYRVNYHQRRDRSVFSTNGIDLRGTAWYQVFTRRTISPPLTLQ